MNELVLKFKSSLISTYRGATVTLFRTVLHCVGFYIHYSMFSIPNPLPKMHIVTQHLYSNPQTSFTHFQIPPLVENLSFRWLDPKKTTALEKRCPWVEVQKVPEVSVTICVWGTEWETVENSSKQVLSTEEPI